MKIFLPLINKIFILLGCILTATGGNYVHKSKKDEIGLKPDYSRGVNRIYHGCVKKPLKSKN